MSKRTAIAGSRALLVACALSMITTTADAKHPHHSANTLAPFASPNSSSPCPAIPPVNKNQSADNNLDAAKKTEKPGFLASLIPYSSLIGGLSAAFATILAGIIAFTLNQRSVHMVWLTSFRRLYDEFWNNPDASKVRRWISNDMEYAEIEDILRRRANTDSNEINASDNNVIETIDKFCALLMKIEYFDRPALKGRPKVLWYQVYVVYWLAKAKKTEFYSPIIFGGFGLI